MNAKFSLFVLEEKSSFCREKGFKFQIAQTNIQKDVLLFYNPVTCSISYNIDLFIL
jgi:hypothetical protein